MFAIVEIYDNKPFIIMKGTYEEVKLKLFEITGKEEDCVINGYEYKIIVI